MNSLPIIQQRLADFKLKLKSAIDARKDVIKSRNEPFQTPKKTSEARRLLDSRIVVLKDCIATLTELEANVRVDYDERAKQIIEEVFVPPSFPDPRSDVVKSAYLGQTSACPACHNGFIITFEITGRENKAVCSRCGGSGRVLKLRTKNGESVEIKNQQHGI